MHIKTETIIGIFVAAALALFVYIGFQIGSFRMGLTRYASYTVCFKDVSGITPKADIKIAGVKVGWVEEVKLNPKDTCVELTLKILKEYLLYRDAKAIIRQEGLLGTKFLELVPGMPPETGDTDSKRTLIAHGGALAFQDRHLVGLDEMFFTFQKVVQQVESMTSSFKDAADETKHFLSELTKRLEPLDSLLDQLKTVSQASSVTFKETAQAVQQVAQGIHSVLDEAKAPFRKVAALAQDIQAGKGSIGKILKDEKLYEDIKTTAEYAQCCVQRIQNVGLMLDSRLEVLPMSRCFTNKGDCNQSLMRNDQDSGSKNEHGNNQKDHAAGHFFDNNHHKTNIKWYFDARLYPCTQFFGLIGLAYSHEGFARRESAFCKRACFDCITTKTDNFRLNLQAGAHVWPCFTVRAGLFDGTAGFGFDYWMPLERFNWLMTWELYDFHGHNSFGSRCRPYLKWYNRWFFGPYAYLNFGVADILNRSNFLIGLGAAFTTADWVSF